MRYFELSPAYGRDYTKKADVISAFQSGKDFTGDYQLNFQLCSIADFKPGDVCNLRYKQLRQVAVFKIPARPSL